MFRQRVTALRRGANAVSMLSFSRVLQLACVFVVTVLLGRSAGPDALGVLSIMLAAGFVMQSVSVAGLAGAALSALIKPGNDFRHELKSIVFARLIMLPVVFSVGVAVLLWLPGMSLPGLTVVITFFCGYAVGAFDVGELSHTANGRFHVMARRRVMLLVAVAPLTFWFAHSGQLTWTLLGLALESALWQLVLIPGAGISVGPLAHAREYARHALVRVWNVRLLWVSSMVSSVGQRVDIFIISAVLGVYAVGQYSAVSRPVEASTVVAGSLIAVLIGSIVRGSDSPKDYAVSSIRASRIMFLTSLTLAFGLVVAGPFLIPFLYGPEFRIAGEIMSVYALSVVFIFLEELLKLVVVVEKQYRLDLLGNICAIGTKVLLNLVLIPPFGLMGAAVAAVVSRPIGLIMVFLPSPAGRRILTLVYGGLFLSSRRAQNVTNKLVRARRRSESA
ncbi:Polysaccharide biosynthesis protein [Kocuria rosea]|uniref:polysaccharide biosynthesis C-terminal domain-containing protein n=1 Tax=Kocuria rosea TaxID=1275 RepID=UPI000F6C61D5|nr:polysaccharide biosynthesis C-terminal domain-containing protein [Kocuria rosea]VEH42546.1 Polysaccharide biosynthesis protein [Kocuria rosea]